MKYEHAPYIAHQIRTVAFEGQLLLCSAYSQLLNRQELAVVDEEDTLKPLRYEEEDDLYPDQNVSTPHAPSTALAYVSVKETDGVLLLSKGPTSPAQ